MNCEYVLWTINLYQLELHWTCIQCNRNLGKLKDLSAYSFTLVSWQLLHLKKVPILQTLESLENLGIKKIYWLYLRGWHRQKHVLSPTYLGLSKASTGHNGQSNNKMWWDHHNTGSKQQGLSHEEPIPLKIRHLQTWKLHLQTLPQSAIVSAVPSTELPATKNLENSADFHNDWGWYFVNYIIGLYTMNRPYLQPDIYQK